MIPRIFKRIPPADFSMQPAKSIRDFKYSEINEDLGYTKRQGLYHFQLTPIGAIEAENDPVNADGSYKHIIWHSIKHQYYNDQYVKEHPHSRTYRYLSDQVDLIATPYLYTGEMIKPNSIKIRNADYDFEIVDDGFGNLYKSNRTPLIASFYDEYKSVCEWDFSTLYPFVRGYTAFNTGQYMLNGEYGYKNTSNLLAKSNYVNCQLANNEYADTKFKGIVFDSGSYIRTPHIPALNFIEGEFLIHFKLYVDDPESLAGINCNLLSVDQVRTIKKKGLQVLSNDKGSYEREMIYESEDTTAAAAYPFKISMTYDAGLKFTFTRSDSQKTTTINATIADVYEFDVQIYRFVANNVNKIAMYINGQLIQVVTDQTKYAFNDYDLVFGNLTVTNAFFILGDVKFYNRIPYSSQNELNQLAADLIKDENYYGGYVGNAFYRNGNIVFTPRLLSDYAYFEDISKFHYSAIYTLYEYEAVCRISKGEFNITYNPTARISPDSDILISEIQDGTMNPYFTTVGLYNEKGELLIIGKTSQAIQVRDDVDINLSIQWCA